MDNIKELKRKVAHLESKVDLLETEFGYLNKLLLECGFPEGVDSLKVTIEELLAESSSEGGIFPGEPPEALGNF